MVADSTIAPPPSAPAAPSVEQTKLQLRAALDEARRLAASAGTAGEFYPGLLNCLSSALAAEGGAVWTLDEDGDPHVAHEANVPASLHDGDEHVAPHRFALADKVAASAEIVFLPPRSSLPDADAANPTPFLLVLAPVVCDGRTRAVIELFIPATANLDVQRGYRWIVEQASAAAAEWFRQHDLVHTAQAAGLWREAEGFARSVHASIDLRATAMAVANEGRRVLGCDRVSVAIRRGRKARLEAVSGQDTINRRAKNVLSLGKLASLVFRSRQRIWYSGATDQLPPQIEEPLQDYLEEAHSKTIAVIPLFAPSPQRSQRADNDQEASPTAGPEPDVLGAVIVESFSETLEEETLSAKTDLVAEHAGCALSNALKYESIFLLPLWRRLGKLRAITAARNLPKTIVVLLLLAAVVYALVAVPASFNLEGRGVLQPVERRDVFADMDGVVYDVPVRHGSEVKQGDVVARLRNTELEVRFSDVLGKLRTTRQQIAGKLRLRHEAELTPAEQSRVAGELLELEQRLASLIEQRTLLERQREQLVIRSPLAGRVVTWNVEQQLMERPVQAGQVLMTVADPDGPWELEVYLPEKRVGHVLAARDKAARRGEERLPVDYVMATEPERRLQGILVEVDQSAQLHNEHGQAVLLRVEIDQHDLREPRVGATAQAKVYCGERALGYVWLHELFEFVQSKVLFYLE